MDEATANVDSETDSLIQSALSRGSGLESGKAVSSIPLPFPSELDQIDK